MRHKVSSGQTKKWLQSLLPICDGDVALAKRELQWMKEAVALKYSEQPKKPIDSLSQEEQEQLNTYVQQRTLQQKPLQYILGTQPFCELDIIVRPPTLIPRWETEEWTYRVIDLLKSKIQQERTGSNEPLQILDLCTGSGCISLALAKHLPKNSVKITGIDISEDAIALAEENRIAHRQYLNNAVAFQQKDLLKLNRHDVQQFGVLVSNPPYIKHDEYDDLDASVKNWEDKRALVADEQGTFIHKRIIELTKYCKPFSKHTPYIFMEIGGQHQVRTLLESMQRTGLHNGTVWKDLAGKDRVVVGY